MADVQQHGLSTITDWVYQQSPSTAFMQWIWPGRHSASKNFS